MRVIVRRLGRFAEDEAQGVFRCHRKCLDQWLC